MMLKRVHTSHELNHFILNQTTIKKGLTSSTPLAVSHFPLQESNFQEKPSFFNEMTDHPDIQSLSAHLQQWLASQSLQKLHDLNTQAKEHFLYHGITFAVYHDDQGTERTIPYDLIPRMIAKKEWAVLSAGCLQRVKALNAFLHDIYGAQDILNAGLIPKNHILSHSSFQPWMLNFEVKGHIYAHISGVDLIRDHHGDFFVLEDNLRTPSGVSYMLESRKISQKIMPDLCQSHVLQGIEHYPQLLKATLEESAWVDQPCIVVLTPGRFNSAYYEHAFLAREMDVPLVSNRDVFVENDKVYLRCLRGKQQIHVIYRRLDDEFLDPLAFRPDSCLGIPGLMSAYRQKNVVIANAPGTGVADDKAIYPYVNEMIHFYLGEDAILKNVPTYQCRRAEDLDYVLQHLDQLVIKEAQGSGGYGMLLGPQATDAELASFREKLIHHPEAYIAQPTLSLSVSPTLTTQGIANRHIDLRPFVLSSPSHTRIVPGGLTRVALKEGSLVVNSSQGGGVKDTWVMTD